MARLTFDRTKKREINLLFTDNYSKTSTENLKLSKKKKKKREREREKEKEEKEVSLLCITLKKKRGNFLVSKAYCIYKHSTYAK